MDIKAEKQGYIKLLLKILLLCIIIYLLDLSFGAGIKKLYFTPKEGKFYDLTYAFDSTKADLIIVGSSKAAHDYISQDIEDSLQIATYNAGNEGAHFLHQFALLKSIFKRYNPKIVVWDYYMGLKTDALTYLELSTVLPYYETHPEIRSIVDSRSKYERYKLVSKIYPYNSTIVYNLNKLVTLYKNQEKDKSIKGYVPLRRVWTSNITNIRRKELNPLDTNCIAAYKWVINYCKSNKIQLVLVNSPLYRNFITTPNYDIIAKEIAEKENIPFIDLSRDTTFTNNKRYFSDPAHLNVEGAKIFTGKIIDELRKIPKI